MSLSTSICVIVSIIMKDNFYVGCKEEEVLNGKLTSFVAAKKLLDAYFSTLK